MALNRMTTPCDAWTKRTFLSAQGTESRTKNILLWREQKPDRMLTNPERLAYNRRAGGHSPLRPQSDGKVTHMAKDTLWFLILLIIAIAIAWWVLKRKSAKASPPETIKKDSGPAQPLVGTNAAKAETPAPIAPAAVPLATPEPAVVSAAPKPAAPAAKKPAAKPKAAAPKVTSKAAPAVESTAPKAAPKAAASKAAPKPEAAPAKAKAAPKTNAKVKVATAPEAEAKPKAAPKAKAEAPKAAPAKATPAPVKPKATPAPAKPKAAPLNAIGIPGATGAPDNLLLLKGVGPKLNTLLGTLEISRFDQIAAWSKADIAKVDAHLGAFKGRIERDAWIEQAGLLAKGKIADFEAKFGKLDSENR